MTDPIQLIFIGLAFTAVVVAVVGLVVYKFYQAIKTPKSS